MNRRDRFHTFSKRIAPTKDQLRADIDAALAGTSSLKYTIRCDCGHVGHIIVHPADLDRTFTCKNCGNERKG